jgi:hypothetical protein
MLQESFATLLNRKLIVPSRNSAYLVIDRHYLVALMGPAVGDIFVDATWYLERSPDVAAAIARGEFASAEDHYKKVGYFEHRLPYAIDVDEPWYLDAYSDVAEAVRSGQFATGKAHFYKDGYREGRFPYANFSLASKRLVE